MTTQWIAWVPRDASLEQMAIVGASVILVLLSILHILLYTFTGLIVTGSVFVCSLMMIVRWLYWNGVGVGGWKWSWLRDSTNTMKKLFSEPQQKGTLRIVCISDTHGKHANVEVPPGDVLIHCGDFTNKGMHEAIKSFNEWLGNLPHRYKIVIAGNHDLSLDGAEYNTHWEKTWRHSTYQDPAISRELLTNCVYLENRSIVIKGVKIYGSPMTPPIPGRVMAFNVERGFAAQKNWSKIPSDVDIVVTHGPPHGILDKTFTGLHVGDEGLLKEIISRCRPQFHVFGHIHEAFGMTRLGKTVFINCATNTLLGKPKHSPVVFDIPCKC